MTAKPFTVACFGEIVMRVSVPDGEMPLQSPRFDAFVGGAEANVAVALASHGLAVRMISALPRGPIGDAAIHAVRAHGVDTTRVERREGRMGLYYHIPGGPVRPAEVLYDRADSAFAAMAASDWNWAELLAGADWLHLSGVTPALGQQSAEAALAAVEAASAAGIGVSFDGNWRGRLWEKWNDDPGAILRRIVGRASILFGNHRDASLLLGRAFSGDGESRRRAAALALLEEYPSLQYVASTARRIVGATDHRIAARVDARDCFAATAEIRIEPIRDRVGTGDAFAAGVLDAIWQGSGPEGAARSGLILSALKHGVRGDFAPFPRAVTDATFFEASDVVR
ncbi:sugar kinase [Sphingopyxis terrae]|uniref:sugar kinase n=1 Tax=Sphingopyxis terrae TaxID=33052 RepID=UPI003F7ECB02